MNPKRLSRGNSKLSKDTGIFSLPAVKTCLNCGDCHLSCYARVAERLYKRTAAYRNQNLELAKCDPNKLIQLINNQIVAENIKIVRIHESGDFFRDGYIDLWETIISANPDVQFYGYSKVFNILDVDKLNAYSNCNIINSLINGKRNYGSEAYVQMLVEDDPDVFVCPAEGCMSTCKKCLTVDKVAFVIHGPNKYKDEYESEEELSNEVLQSV